jgi:hypothetical protein
MDGTTTIDVCADGACVMPAEFVRLRYFFGQRLGVIDLADEQSYFAGKLRFHNLRAHGVGVLCGLIADRYVYPQAAPPATATTLLRVRRGAALDPCGREIVVGWDQCIDVAAWFAQHPAAHPPAPPEGGGPRTSLRLWVALCYRECPSDPAPAPRDPCGCDAGGCEFARIREGFELRLATDAEAKLLAPGGRVPHAAAILTEEVIGGSVDEAYARLAAQIAGADCPPPPADPCLLLASFTAVLDAAGAKVIDISQPDNAIAERLSLLATAVLQQGLLRALAAASDAELVGPGPRLRAISFTNPGAASGTLAIAIHDEDGALSRDPFAAPAQLSVKVSQFKDDGTWESADPATAAYVALPAPHLELGWPSGLVDGGRYRVLVESDRALPPVDTRMRPLTPASWARHFRLQKGADGNLALAATLF